MTQLIQIKHLRDYSKCPNYAKYNWYNEDLKLKSNICKQVVTSCYRDIFVLNKKVDWKTVRNRIHSFISKENSIEADKIYSFSIALMSGMRDWYLQIYRDGPVEGIGPFLLEEKIFEETIQIQIDGLLNDNKSVTLIHYCNEEADWILKDPELRIKIYLLSKQKIKINKVLVISCSETSVKTKTITVDNVDNWNLKTEKMLGLFLYSIKNKVFYPSITKDCSSCRFSDICSW